MLVGVRDGVTSLSVQGHVVGRDRPYCVIELRLSTIAFTNAAYMPERAVSDLDHAQHMALGLSTVCIMRVASRLYVPKELPLAVQVVSQEFQAAAYSERHQIQTGRRHESHLQALKSK